jgi:ribosome-binding protein aMBF1 (putative translation factor)
MTADKKRRVEKMGWKVGSVNDFLSLSPEEAAYVELKVRLAKALKTRRQRLGISQVEVAKRLQSSQSRVAKMEAGDPTVSIDLLVRSVLALGGRVTLLPKAV